MMSSKKNLLEKLKDKSHDYMLGFIDGYQDREDELKQLKEIVSPLPLFPKDPKDGFKPMLFNSQIECKRCGLTVDINKTANISCPDQNCDLMHKKMKD